MEKNEPNKIVKRLVKRFETINKVSDSERYDWKEHEQIKKELEAITNVVGAIEVMSKNTLITLVALQSKLRFMPEHRFYMQFAEAAKYMKLLGD